MNGEDQPICYFVKLKQALARLGYTVRAAQLYVPLKKAKVNSMSIQQGDVELTSEGIYYLNPLTGNRQQVFLYKPYYHLRDFGKPRFHVCNCETLQKMGRDLYCGANTETVTVHDMDTQENVIVSGLPLCRYCLKMMQQQGQQMFHAEMNTAEYEQILRQAAEASVAAAAAEVDLAGYVRNWAGISEAYRTKHRYTCEQCGFAADTLPDRQYIHVHHRDGNKLNNKESNLQCLCIACHANVDAVHQHNFSRGANRAMLDEFLAQHGAPPPPQPFYVNPDDLPF